MNFADDKKWILPGYAKAILFSGKKTLINV